MVENGGSSQLGIMQCQEGCSWGRQRPAARCSATASVHSVRGEEGPQGRQVRLRTGLGHSRQRDPVCQDTEAGAAESWDLEIIRGTGGTARAAEGGDRRRPAWRFYLVSSMGPAENYRRGRGQIYEEKGRVSARAADCKSGEQARPGLWRTRGAGPLTSWGPRLWLTVGLGCGAQTPSLTTPVPGVSGMAG